MPRDIKITLFTYDELSPRAKSVARDEWRKLDGESGDDSWSDNVQSGAKEAAAHMGWDFTELLWSGFASQGDGAQFEGDWSASRVDAAALKRDWTLVNAQTGEPIDETSARTNRQLHDLVDRFAAFAAQYPNGTATVKHEGHYLHSRANEFEVDFQTEQDTRGYEGGFIEISRQLMDLFYKKLEREYDYHNSDEVVGAELRQRECEFTRDGKQYTAKEQG